jgi:hypothetical protein
VILAPNTAWHCGDGWVCTRRPSYGMTRSGYTSQAGAPSSKLIRLEGERIWRRLMIWQFSNAGTAFVRIKGKPFVVPDHTIPPC